MFARERDCRGAAVTRAVVMQDRVYREYLDGHEYE